MRKVAVLIKSPDQQYEGMRSSWGMLLYDTRLQVFVFHHEIANIDEVYHDNMQFLDEMEGERFSDNQVNLEKYGFKHTPMEEMAVMLKRPTLLFHQGGCFSSNLNNL